MTVRNRAEVDQLPVDALAHYSAFIAAAQAALNTTTSRRRAAALRTIAATRAVEVADDVVALADELAHKTREADIAHQHMGAATHTAWREKARADAAEDECTRLRAENDQLRAALAAPAVTP